MLLGSFDHSNGCFHWKYMLPGIREAVAIFSTFCALEWVYNKISGPKGCACYRTPRPPRTPHQFYPTLWIGRAPTPAWHGGPPPFPPTADRHANSPLTFLHQPLSRAPSCPPVRRIPALQLIDTSARAASYQLPWLVASRWRESRHPKPSRPTLTK